MTHAIGMHNDKDWFFAGLSLKMRLKCSLQHEKKFELVTYLKTTKILLLHARFVM